MIHEIVTMYVDTELSIYTLIISRLPDRSIGNVDLYGVVETGPLQLAF